MGSSLQKVGDFFALKDLADRQKYLVKQQEAVAKEIAELEKIKSSLDFFDQRISDLKQTGFKKVTVETCLEEYLEVSPFRHGVFLNLISFGPRYGVIIDDFERAEISRFFKWWKRKRVISSKSRWNTPAFTRKWRMTKLLETGCRYWIFLKSAAKVVPPFYQEDFSSSVLGHDGSVIIKYSAKLDL